MSAHCPTAYIGNPNGYVSPSPLVSISAFSGQQMQALGVVDSFDIAAFTPGVHLGGSHAGKNTQFSIRGVT